MDEHWEAWFEERNVETQGTSCRSLLMNRDAWSVTYLASDQSDSIPVIPCYGFHEDAPTLTTPTRDTRARRVALVAASSRDLP